MNLKNTPFILILTLGLWACDDADQGSDLSLDTHQDSTASDDALNTLDAVDDAQDLTTDADLAPTDLPQDVFQGLTKEEIWAEGLGEGVNWGIAADYPLDQGLAAHPAVYAVEDFESGSVELYTEEDRLLNHVQVVQGEHYSGEYSGEFSWDEGENGPTTRFPLPEDPEDNPGGAYFMRICYNFDASFHPQDQSLGVGVKGFGVNAEGLGTNANTPCDGSNWYNAQVQFVGWGGSSKPQANDGFLWVGHLYSYNPDPEAATPVVGTLEVSNPATGDRPYRFSSYGDPFDYIRFNSWRCYEVGLYLNTPGQNDGEARFWIDGVLQSRLTHMRYRDLASLLPNNMQVNLHRTTADFPHTMVRWMDNIVMSRRYIGPVAMP